MRREREPLGHPHLVAPDRQRPLGGERGVELADGAGGGVAGVHEGREALLGAALVERGEVLQRHVQLAPHLQQRRRALDVQRDRADRAQVVGDVLADLPIAAGDAALEHAVAVDQRDRQAVDLRLDHVQKARLGDALAREVVAHPLDPRAELLLGAGVGEREHRLQVRDLLQPPHRAAPDALRGRVGHKQLGVRGLQRPQFIEQRVVLVVPDEGIVEHVVAVGVVLDHAPQLGDVLCRVGHLGGVRARHRTSRPRGRAPAPRRGVFAPRRSHPRPPTTSQPAHAPPGNDPPAYPTIPAGDHLSRPPPRRRRAGRSGRSRPAPRCPGGR